MQSFRATKRASGASKEPLLFDALRPVPPRFSRAKAAPSARVLRCRFGASAALQCDPLAALAATGLGPRSDQTRCAPSAVDSPIRAALVRSKTATNVIGSSFQSSIPKRASSISMDCKLYLAASAPSNTSYAHMGIRKMPSFATSPSGCKSFPCRMAAVLPFWGREPRKHWSRPFQTLTILR